jgi:transposase
LGGAVDLTNEQWKVLEPLIPKPPAKKDGRGRPRKEPREVLNGILWILRTGAPWPELPEKYPSFQTCHRRFQEWVRNVTLENILKALAEDLKQRGKLDLEECFIDGTFIPAKKGILRWQDQTGKGYENHGNWRPRWSSYLHLRRKR